MTVDTRHPDYVDREEEWRVMRDSARGEKAVKDSGRAQVYLPMPSGFAAQPDGGVGMYGAYQTRAQFPEILSPTVRGMIGIIHRTEAQIEIPKRLEPIFERATKDGLPLESFHRRVTEELLLMGRYSLLADAPSGGADVPYLVGYGAEYLINWSDERDLFVLDESGLERDEFVWSSVRKHRVLRLDGGRYVAEVHDEKGNSKVLEPERARGLGALEQIPFVVIGARDLSIKPETPPLIGVGRSALATYRLDADYRHQLFMTGQETLVIINGAKPGMVGAGVVIELQGETGRQPDAKYVGPSGRGIEAHRIAIQDERENAVQAGARLFEDQTKAAESGEAKKLRYAAQTATLTTVALASAQGLEKALRHAALMIGEDPMKVVVKPNLKFIESTLSPGEVKDLITAWQGGGFSYQTLYENLQRGEIASQERTADEERALIEEEMPEPVDDPEDPDAPPDPDDPGAQ